MFSHLKQIEKLMSDVSIKITIAGRVYPLTVDENEREIVEKAAERVDNSVRMFMKSYAVKDKQDLLAMTALQMATSANNNDDGQDKQELLNELRSLEKLLDTHLHD